MRSLNMHRMFRLAMSATMAAAALAGCGSEKANDPTKPAGTAATAVPLFTCTASPASASPAPAPAPPPAPGATAAPARPPAAPAAGAPATGPAATQPADAYAWPREFDAGGDHYAIYQPQVQWWKDDALEARAAVAVTHPGSHDADYGIITLTARTDVEKDIRMVTLDQIATPRRSSRRRRIRSPSTWAMRNRAADATREVPLDHLEANVAMTKARNAEAVPAVAVKNDPPKIIFATTPTLLIIIDGQPTMRGGRKCPASRTSCAW